MTNRSHIKTCAASAMTPTIIMVSDMDIVLWSSSQMLMQCLLKKRKLFASMDGLGIIQMLLYMQHSFCHQQNATACSWPCNPLKGFSNRKADYFIKKPLLMRILVPAFFVSSRLPPFESQVFNSILVECNVREIKYP